MESIFKEVIMVFLYSLRVKWKPMNEVIFIGITHAVFIIIFTLSKENRSISDNTLIVWMAFLAMPLVVRVLGPDLLDIQVPIVGKILAYPLCFGPFLWLYVKCLTEDIKRYRLSHLWHFFPFLLAALSQITFQESTVYPSAITTDIAIHNFIGMMNIVSLLCYSGMVVWRLRKHSAEVLNSFSSLSTKITLRWLVWLTCGFIVAYLFPLFTSLSVHISHGYAFTGFIFMLSFFGLKQTQVFRGQKDQIENVETDNEVLVETVKMKPKQAKIQSEQTNSEPIKEKYERSGLTLERAIYYLKRLDTYTQDEKPYLDANLTIYKLAKQSHIPQHYLTQIFSEQLSKNFYTYINEYRVNNIKLLLNDPENTNMTLLDMAFESGFNSKSTFNAAFKKITSMTPTQYKKHNARS